MSTQTPPDLEGLQERLRATRKRVSALTAIVCLLLLIGGTILVFPSTTEFIRAGVIWLLILFVPWFVVLWLGISLFQRTGEREDDPPERH